MGVWRIDANAALAKGRVTNGRTKTKTTTKTSTNNAMVFGSIPAAHKCLYDCDLLPLLLLLRLRGTLND